MARRRAVPAVRGLVLVATVALVAVVLRPGHTVVPVGNGVGVLVLAPRLMPGTQPAAQPSGILAVIGGNCVGLANGPDESALILPAGTRALPDGDGIRTPEGLEVHFGDEVLAGGGGRDADPADDWMVQRWPAAPSGCTGAGSATSLRDVQLVDADGQGR